MSPVDTSVETGTIDLPSPPGWDEPTSTMPVFQIPDPQPVAASPTFIRPGRAGLPEIALAGLALLLNAWHLERNGLGNTYYAAAVRSMTTGWKAFFYGSLDPGNWITTDKPPGALWLQALSARIFGYSGWSLLLPSAVCGALAVYLLIVTVRRVWGTTAGLVAGSALALTPAVVAVSRSNNPDALLMLTVVAAAWATERAITTKRVHWLMAAGAICGFGFLTKLLVVGAGHAGVVAGLPGCRQRAVRQASSPSRRGNRSLRNNLARVDSGRRSHAHDESPVHRRHDQQHGARSRVRVPRRWSVDGNVLRRGCNRTEWTRRVRTRGTRRTRRVPWSTAGRIPRDDCGRVQC